MLKYSKLIFFYILLDISVNNAEIYKKCSVSYLNVCPNNSACIEMDGVCICSNQYEFNKNYKDDSDYCLQKKSSISKTTAAPGGYLFNSDKRATEVIYNNEKPSSHIGGILILIILILVILGIIIAIKKTKLVSRIQNMIITRRSRPFYGDVMMSNDNDDPPLI